MTKRALVSQAEAGLPYPKSAWAQPDRVRRVADEYCDAV